MSFAQTYREEKLIDRRARGRKARIAGRVIGFVLVAALMLFLRTNPELVERMIISAIGDRDTWRVSTLAELEAAAEGQTPAGLQVRAEQGGGTSLGLDLKEQTVTANKPVVSQMPKSSVTVRRAGVAASQSN